MKFLGELAIMVDPLPLVVLTHTHTHSKLAFTNERPKATSNHLIG